LGGGSVTDVEGQKADPSRGVGGGFVSCEFAIDRGGLLVPVAVVAVNDRLFMFFAAKVDSMYPKVEKLKSTVLAEGRGYNRRRHHLPLHGLLTLATTPYLLPYPRACSLPSSLLSASKSSTSLLYNSS